MKNISIWAKNNVLVARVLIFFIHLLLIFLAFYITANIHFKFSYTELTVIICFWVTTVFIYSYVAKQSYLIHKVLNFITASCFFLIICFFIKHNFRLPYFQNTLNAVSVSGKTNKHSSAQEILESLKYRNKGTLTKKENRILKKEFGKQLYVFNERSLKHNDTTATNALLILLAIIAVVGLLAVLSLLVCAISCGGAGALLIIVFVLGIAGFSFALFAILKSLTQRHNKKSKPESTNTGFMNDLINKDVQIFSFLP